MSMKVAVNVETPVSYDGGDWCWFHPRAAAIPGAGRDGGPAVVVTLQKHLNVSDYYSGLHTMRTDDLGETWSDPEPVPELGWEVQADGSTLSVCDVTPGWHEPSGRVLAIGVRVPYAATGEQQRHYEPVYAVHDPITGVWSPWRVLEGWPMSGVGCSQWVVKPDGSLLVPLFSVGLSEDGPREDTGISVARCTFDGSHLCCVEHSQKLRLDVPLGVGEPSLTCFRGRYYLTLRSGENGYVTVSDDGLAYGPIREWLFDDGTPLGSENTQQHWVTHREGLYLVYTRTGAGNNHIFRHRAPLLIAEVDVDNICVRRDTETIAIPERGVPMGNFGAAGITDDEAWITVGEFMWPDYVNRNRAREHGACGAVLVGRVRWTSSHTPR
jgi:hypothetical protein